jgi:hypothetical protein
MKFLSVASNQSVRHVWQKVWPQPEILGIKVSVDEAKVRAGGLTCKA